MLIKFKMFTTCSKEFSGSRDAELTDAGASKDLSGSKFITLRKATDHP
jgi:hypothetical protein